MIRRHLPRATLYLMLLLLASAGPAGYAQVDAGAARGKEILLPFKQNLMQALQSGLQQGPEAALDVCRLQAPGIAAGFSTGGIRVGRTSHKLRNPDNTGPAWAQPLLQAYLDDPGDRQPHTVTLADGRTGYVEPIVLQPLCTTCHGVNVAPAVLAHIRLLYPEDQATGFAAGDLRGIFWAEFP